MSGVKNSGIDKVVISANEHAFNTFLSPKITGCLELMASPDRIVSLSATRWKTT